MIFGPKGRNSTPHSTSTRGRECCLRHHKLTRTLPRNFKQSRSPLLLYPRLPSYGHRCLPPAWPIRTNPVDDMMPPCALTRSPSTQSICRGPVAWDQSESRPPLLSWLSDGTLVLRQSVEFADKARLGWQASPLTALFQPSRRCSSGRMVRPGGLFRWDGGLFWLVGRGGALYPTFVAKKRNIGIAIEAIAATCPGPSHDFRRVGASAA